MNTWTTAMLSIAISLVSAAVSVAAPVQWTAASGGNGLYYERIDQTGLTFDQAKSAAAAKSYLGQPGHLAVFETANYTNEFNFVYANVYSPGASSDRVYWVGASRAITTGGGAGENWKWVDGTAVPTSITSGWNIDFFEGSVDEAANFFRPTSATLWDYASSDPSNYVNGYVVEYGPLPEPATLLAGSIGVFAIVGRRRAR